MTTSSNEAESQPNAAAARWLEHERAHLLETLPAELETDRDSIRETLAAFDLALELGQPDLVVHQALWTEKFLRAHGGRSLIAWLGGLSDTVLAAPIDPLARLPMLALLGETEDAISGAAWEAEPLQRPAQPESSRPLDKLFREYFAALLQTDRQRAASLVLHAVQGGMPLRDVYVGVFARTQQEIGARWARGEISVADEHYCTAATQVVMAQLYPYLFTGKPKARTVVATTVVGDLHELAIRIVTDFFEMDGWNTIYLGANMPSEEVVAAARQHKADLLAVSATLYSHIRPLKKLLSLVLRDFGAAAPQTLVGGIPFLVCPQLVSFVGASASARDGDEAVRVAQHLVGGR